MSAPRGASPAGIGVVAGLVLLLVLVGFAVGLPRIVGDSAPGDDAAESAEGGAGSDAAIELPESIGSWVSLPSLLSERATEDQLEEYEQYFEYADSALADSVEGASDAQRYADLASGAQIAVQAYRGPDGPLVPALLADPASGQARILLQEYGDAECVLDVVAGSETTSPQVQELQCRITSDDLTVRGFVIEGASGDQVADLLGQLFDRLSGADAGAEDDDGAAGDGAGAQDQ